MVNIKVGERDEQTSFCILQRLSKTMSSPLVPQLETCAIHVEKGQATPMLPENNVMAWRVLLYTYMARSLPPMYFIGPFWDSNFDELSEMPVKCWLLGDKRDVVEFQDLIMAELLSLLTRMCGSSKGMIVAAPHARPESKVYSALTRSADELLDRHYAKDQIPPLEEALERDDISQHFVDRVEQLEEEDFEWPGPVYDQRNFYMSFAVDGGPRQDSMNVPNPWRGCHGKADDASDDGGGGEDRGQSDEEREDSLSEGDDKDASSCAGSSCATARAWLLFLCPRDHGTAHGLSRAAVQSWNLRIVWDVLPLWQDVTTRAAVDCELSTGEAVLLQLCSARYVPC